MTNAIDLAIAAIPTMTSAKARQVLAKAFPEASILRGWCLDGAGESRHGVYARHATGKHQWLGKTWQEAAHAYWRAPVVTEVIVISSAGSKGGWGVYAKVSLLAIDDYDANKQYLVKDYDGVVVKAQSDKVCVGKTSACELGIALLKMMGRHPNAPVIAKVGQECLAAVQAELA